MNIDIKSNLKDLRCGHLVLFYFVLKGLFIEAALSGPFWELKAINKTQRNLCEKMNLHNQERYCRNWWS